jgi:acetate kinase
MDWLGITIDEEKNEKTVGCEGEISASSSKVAVFAIPTNEELVIAMDTEEVVSKLADQ